MNFYKSILENIQSYIIIKDKLNNVVWYNDKKALEIDSLPSINSFYELDNKFYDCVSRIIELKNEECILKEYRDVSEYANQIEKLNKDHLTGLYTRNKIIEKLERLTNLSKEHNKTFSLVMGDIDYFKSINDEFGHLNGDEVLKYVSSTIKDVLGLRGIVGRFGGEEFIIILPGKDSTDAYNLIEVVRDILSNSKVKIDGKETNVTMTFGISSSTGDKNIKSLIEEADKALYNGKRTGRNKTLIYEE